MGNSSAKKPGLFPRSGSPHFANYRRDGYDFDTLWDEEKASMRSKKIMDQFEANEMLPSNELKRLAGFGKGGEKNFDGTVTDLQMQTYLVIRDFRRRRNKMGLEYGIPISVFSTSEALWGYEHISSAYHIDPAESLNLIVSHLMKYEPEAEGSTIRYFLK